MDIAELVRDLAEQGVELWFEGEGLRFRTGAGTISEAQASRIEAYRADILGYLRARAATEWRTCELSHGQQAIWFLHQHAPDSPVHNVSLVARVLGAVNVGALGAAVQALVDRHEILRTAYGEVDGEICQKIAGSGVGVFNVKAIHPRTAEELNAIVDVEHRRPFDLARGAVLRVSLLTLGDADHVLLATPHHIAVDGWTGVILVHELFKLYEAAAAGRPSDLSKPTLNYSDYCAWESAMLAGPEGDRLWNYWRRAISAPRTPLDLPTDRPRPATKTYEGAAVRFLLEPAITERIKQLTRREATTPFVVLLACFHALLFRLTGAEDIIVGTPALARKKSRFLRVLGNFINPLPLRAALSANMKFSELVRRLHQTVREALDAQEFPFSLMVRRLQPERDPSRSPLFDFFFVLQRFHKNREIERLLYADEEGDVVELGGLRLGSYPFHQQQGQFDLTLQIVERAGAFRGTLKYSTDLFEEPTARRFAAEYVNLVDMVTNDPDFVIGSALPIGIDPPPATRSHRESPDRSRNSDDRPAPDRGVIHSGEPNGTVDGNRGAPLAAQRDETREVMTTRQTDVPADDVGVILAELGALGVRLSVDDERLKVNAPKGALNDRLKAAIASHREEIIARTRANRSRAFEDRKLRHVARAPPLPLTAVQKRFWFLDKVGQGRSVPNVTFPLRFEGPLDFDAMMATVNAVLIRHEALLMRIGDRDGEPFPEITAVPGDLVTVADLTALPEERREHEGDRLSNQFTQDPFNLATGPLAKVLFVRLSTTVNLLTFSMHHIVADGWSMSILLRELGAVYSAVSKGGAPALPPLPYQYVDYAAWEVAQVRDGLFERQLGYWREKLAGVPPLLDLPTDRPRPTQRSFRGSRVDCIIEADMVARLQQFSNRHDATLFMTVFAAFATVLHRLTGQDEIVIGTPVANRGTPDLEQIVGPFVNSLSLRLNIAGNPSFESYLSQVRRATIEAIDNRDLPFDMVVEAINPARTLDHAPIFQVMFGLHNFPVQPPRFEGLACAFVSQQTQVARLDLQLDMVVHEGRLFGGYEYASDLFDHATIERVHEQLVEVLNGILADDGKSVRDLPMRTAAHDRVLLDVWNDTRLDHDREVCLHQLLERAAAWTPDATAFVIGAESFSYRDIDRRANQLAHLLRLRGVRRGDRVGVCLDRSVEAPLAIAAVLKAGGAYVPLDPTHPSERLRFIVEDARVACVVTMSAFAALFDAADVPRVLLDAQASELDGLETTAPTVPVAPEDLAYVIFTSGSTGRPKGVEVEHRNVVSFLAAMRREPGLTASDVVLAVTTFSFDIAGLEIWLPLSVGAKIVLASRAAVTVGGGLVDLIDRHDVTMMQATPSTWRLLIDAGWSGKSDMKALCGGEAMPIDLASGLLMRVGQVWNMYGPTETTIWSTAARIVDATGAPPIGKPIANTRVYVLDPMGALAPLGGFGELAIGGEGVARGYWNRPELTAEKFVNISLPDGRAERVFRTGDIVRFRNDGQLEFHGRRDHQIKLRGYRIELGEIEAILASCPGVNEAAVSAREDEPGDPRLVGYVVARVGAAFEPDAARAILKAALPSYMVPAEFVVLAAMPLTPNGKVDRAALPAPRRGMGEAHHPLPEIVMTPTQRRIADLWSEILRTDRISLHDNFFDVGGHSMLVVKLHAALKREFQSDVTLTELFQQTTVAAQAARVSRSADGDLALHRAEARVRKRLHG